MSLNTARRLESGNLMTPKGRMLYPALFKPQLPRGETDEKKAKYQATLLFPVGCKLSVNGGENVLGLLGFDRHETGIPKRSASALMSETEKGFS